MATPESILQKINKKFVTLNPDEKKHVNSHYMKVLDKLITIMQCKDSLFNDIYQRLFFAGSFYDGLKICRPEEFDVDVVIDLPIDYSEMSFSSKKVPPGFIKIQARQMEELQQDAKMKNIYTHMRTWTDQNGSLLQSELRKWMLNVVDKALSSLERPRNNAQLNIDGEIYQILRRANGPAITLLVTMPDGQTFEVDLVPVLEFQYPEHWPPQVRKNPFPDIESWFIVPKSNSKNPKEFRDTFWRLAFHAQERELIKDKGQLKPVCRLIKKLRDTHGLHRIYSYYIKTVILWKVDETNENDPDYWRNANLSDQFLEILRSLSTNLADKKIDYYWNRKNNLLTGSGMSDVEMISASQNLNKIIGEIERKMHKNPSVFAKYLLTEEEFDVFIDELNVEYPNVGSGIMHYQTNDRRVEGTVKALQNELYQLRDSSKKHRVATDAEVQSLAEAVAQLQLANEALQDSLNRQQSGIGRLLKKNKEWEKSKTFIYYVVLFIFMAFVMYQKTLEPSTEMKTEL